MQGILSFIRHLFGAMLKGFFFTGLVAAIACAACYSSPNRITS